jgi:hypothetical protein
MLLFEAALLMLFIKHWLCDFVWQTQPMMRDKGTYGAKYGVLHSVYHGLGTFAVFAVSGMVFALFLAIIDFVFHYHIDWAKMKYGNKDNATSRYWAEFGLDQLAHSATYLIIVAIFVRSV